MEFSKVTDAASFRHEVARQGGLISDGPVQDGWAVHPFFGSRKRGQQRAHHWTRGETLEIDGQKATRVDTACGHWTCVTASVPLLGAGNYELCSRCERVLMKRMVAPPIAPSEKTAL